MRSKYYEVHPLRKTAYRYKHLYTRSHISIGCKRELLTILRMSPQLSALPVWFVQVHEIDTAFLHFYFKLLLHFHVSRPPQLELRLAGVPSPLVFGRDEDCLKGFFSTKTFDAHRLTQHNKRFDCKTSKKKI